MQLAAGPGVQLAPIRYGEGGATKLLLRKCHIYGIWEAKYMFKCLRMVVWKKRGRSNKELHFTGRLISCQKGFPPCGSETFDSFVSQMVQIWIEAPFTPEMCYLTLKRGFMVFSPSISCLVKLSAWCFCRWVRSDPNRGMRYPSAMGQFGSC